MRSTLTDAVVGRLEEYAVAFCAGEPDVVDGTTFGLARSAAEDAGYARARAALKVALLLERGSARYEDVAPLALIMDAPDADRDAFVEAQLGPALHDPSGDELLRSLAEYYASGQSVAGAARALHVHRHTLEYRLDRLEKLLGPRIKEATGRMLVELALSLVRKGR
jgi:DNA-binding PucR family transcriptional regulator